MTFTNLSPIDVRDVGERSAQGSNAHNVPPPSESIMRSVFLAFLLLALSTACTVGPEFRPPREGLPARFVADPLTQTESAASGLGNVQRFVPQSEAPAAWWSSLGSSALDALIASAFEANPSLKALDAATRAAQETALAQRGALFPSLQAGWSSQRGRVSEQASSPLSTNAQIFTLHAPQVSVSYVFDLFGANRRALESADALARQQDLQREAAYLTIAGNICIAAIQEAALREQLAAARDIVRIEREQLELMRKQYELGGIPRINVVAQEAAMAQAVAAVPPLEKQIAQQRHALAALAGRFPAEMERAEFNLSDFRLPPDLPLTMPSRIVERRPDILAAEEQLHAASAQVGVAMANMLPQITLTASGGYQGTDFAHLLDPQNMFWNLGAGLLQPLFQGGTLLHRKRAAEAALEQARQQYRAVVLGAFQNVADAMRAVEIDAKALAAAAAAEAAARASLDMTRKQLDLGDINYLGLLAAQQGYQQAVIARVQAQAARLSDTVAFFQATAGKPVPNVP